MTASRSAAPPVSPLGTLADGVVGSGGAGGLVQLDRAGIEIDWWIGADDGWKIPAPETAHTVRPGLAPAIETRVRVPGGEVVARTYAIAHSGAPLVVVELENASPAAAVIAWVVRAAPGYRIGRVAIEGSTLLIDERARVELPRAPTRWAVDARSVGVHDAVVEGRAASGAFAPVTTRRGDLEVAVLFPVAHRTKTRIAVAPPSDSGAAPGAIAVAQLPALADVERGWESTLDRGARVELPDANLQAVVDMARATVLLGSGRRDRVVANAAAAWGLRDCRLPRRRATRFQGDPWPQLKAAAGGASASVRSAADWLLMLKGALVSATRDRIDVLPRLPDEWLGQALAVHDLPTPNGPVSFALRWHGTRPALLWDVPAGVRIRAPGIDAAWEGAGGAGETLLGEIDVTRLLHLHTATGAEPGVVVDEPGSFT
jgi:hypothetical protein